MCQRMCVQEAKTVYDMLKHIFLFITRLVCGAFPPLNNFTPRNHHLASYISACLLNNLLMPALYSWNTVTAEPFISHPRHSSHTWHSQWVLKGAAAMWGWFALRLAPPNPYQCPIYLCSYNPNPLICCLQMSGWALSCLLFASSAFLNLWGNLLREYSADPLQVFWCCLIFLCLSWPAKQHLAHLLAKHRRFFCKHLPLSFLPLWLSNFQLRTMSDWQLWSPGYFRERSQAQLPLPKPKGQFSTLYCSVRNCILFQSALVS